MLGGSDGFLDPVLQTIPLWVFGVLIFVVCVIAREGGVWVRRRAGAGDDAEKSDAEGYIITAIFALLAFMVGLTFSIAIDRYDDRRALVAEEANAISTAYLRASLFDEPFRSTLQSTLRQYAHTRIAPDGLWDERMETQLERSQALRGRFWSEARAAIMPVRETELASYFVDAVNEVLNVGARRNLLGRAHIPTRILDILLLYLIVSSAVLGYLLGGRPGRKRQASTLLVALFTIAIVLILDIDRPRSGSVNVPQRALEELVATLDGDRIQPR